MPEFQRNFKLLNKQTFFSQLIDIYTIEEPKKKKKLLVANRFPNNLPVLRCDWTNALCLIVKQFCLSLFLSLPLEMVCGALYLIFDDCLLWKKLVRWSVAVASLVLVTFCVFKRNQSAQTCKSIWSKKEEKTIIFDRYVDFMVSILLRSPSFAVFSFAHLR